MGKKKKRHLTIKKKSQNAQYIFFFLDISLNITTFKIKQKIKVSLFLWAQIFMCELQKVGVSDSKIFLMLWRICDSEESLSS